MEDEELDLDFLLALANEADEAGPQAGEAQAQAAKASAPADNKTRPTQDNRSQQADARAYPELAAAKPAVRGLSLTGEAICPHSCPAVLKLLATHVG